MGAQSWGILHLRWVRYGVVTLKRPHRALGEGAADGSLDDRVRRVVHLHGHQVASAQQGPGAV